MVPVHFQDWGLIPYAEALERQIDLQSGIVKLKLENRIQSEKPAGKSDESLKIDPEPENIPLTNKKPIENFLIFCEHPPVYTLGNRASEENILWTQEELIKEGVAVFPIRRGGDVTFHGPGQIVGYPILDLEQFFTDIHRYLRYLEEAVIQTLAEFNLNAGRIEGLSGVWMEAENPEKSRKICAVGVHCSRWVTMHGFAFNINTDLSYFEHIIPCGIRDKGVTSLQKELGKSVDIEKVKSILLDKIAAGFAMDLQK